MNRFAFWEEAHGMLDIFEAANKCGIITVPNDYPGAKPDGWEDDFANDYEWYVAESNRLHAAAPWWNVILFERLASDGMLELVEMPEYGNGFAFGAKWRITERGVFLIEWLLAGAPGSSFRPSLSKRELLIA